jgi:hypothetical protein
MYGFQMLMEGGQEIGFFAAVFGKKLIDVKGVSLTQSHADEIDKGGFCRKSCCFNIEESTGI